jgi:hypothetical protein
VTPEFHKVDIKFGSTYKVSKETVLDAEVNAMDPLAALNAEERLPAGSTFRGIGNRAKDGVDWYKVEVTIRGRKRVMWVNSMRLIGQTLVQVEEPLEQEQK